jgi:hypothetical protein
MDAVLPGLEKRVERAKAHTANVNEVKARLEQTTQSFRHLQLPETDQVQRIVSCLDRQSHKLRRAAEPLGRKIWRQKPGRFSRRLKRP